MNTILGMVHLGACYLGWGGGTYRCELLLKRVLDPRQLDEWQSFQVRSVAPSVPSVP